MQTFHYFTSTVSTEIFKLLMLECVLIVKQLQEMCPCSCSSINKMNGEMGKWEMHSTDLVLFQPCSSKSFTISH